LLVLALFTGGVGWGGVEVEGGCRCRAVRERAPLWTEAFARRGREGTAPTKFWQDLAAIAAAENPCPSTILHVFTENPCPKSERKTKRCSQKKNERRSDMIFRPTPPPGGWSQSWAACLHRIGVNTEVPEGKSALKDGMHRKGGPFRSSRTHKLIGWTRISSFSATTLL